jgi:hypothetical protein
VWSASRPSRLCPQERPSTHCTAGWVGPEAGLDKCGKSRPTGIRSPDLPARSESLYRLRYPGLLVIVPNKNCIWCLYPINKMRFFRFLPRYGGLARLEHSPLMVTLFRITQYACWKHRSLAAGYQTAMTSVHKPVDTPRGTKRYNKKQKNRLHKITGQQKHFIF